MNILSATEVKKKLEENPEVHLVMTLEPRHFEESHIPGSINMYTVEMAEQLFDIEDEIIVYCSDINGFSCTRTYEGLEALGYKNIWRFAGGMEEWREAGFPSTDALNTTIIFEEFDNNLNL